MICTAEEISLVIKSRRRWVEHVACMEDMLGAYRILVGRPEENNPLGRPRRRWKMIFNRSSRSVTGAMDWIDLAQDKNRWRAVVNSVIKLRVP